MKIKINPKLKFSDKILSHIPERYRDASMCSIDNRRFETGGDFHKAFREAGYDESPFRIILTAEAWQMSAREWFKDFD